MDVSKFKDIIKKVSVFKNYSSLLVPVVIVLVGVLLFVATQLMGGKLKKRIADESISKGKQVESLSSKPVALDQWKEEQEYQQAHERDANAIALFALQSTQRQLLSYKIFPEPKDTSALIFGEFGRQFCAVIDELIARVNARDCPTETELERSLQSRSSSDMRRRRGRSRRRLSEVDATIVDVLCRDKAESACFYANPADLSGYEFWEEYKYAGMDEAVKDCWYYQLACWVIEDVIDTTGTLNSGSNSVFTSSVKRLLNVSFTTKDRVRRSKRVREKVIDDRPSYVLSIRDGLTMPWTERLCNDDIDVVHFNVSVVVSTKAVLAFMQQLCSAKQHKFRGFSGESQEQVFKHNQITILQSQITPIDREDDTHSLYRYGEDAVVRLDLICEYIFKKSVLDEIKPKSVEEFLKRPEV